MKIYVANLGSEINERDLQEAFSAFGTVASANIATDRYSGESRGFGFVEMPERTEGVAAVAGLNGTELKGRTLKVEEARPPSTTGNRRYGGGGGERRSAGGKGGGARRRTW